MYLTRQDRDEEEIGVYAVLLDGWMDIMIWYEGRGRKRREI